MTTDAQLADRARTLDAADPLAGYRTRFVGHDDESVTAYLDGNSLGRPLAASVDRVREVMLQQWGGRLIRAWDEGWLALPERVGDELGRVVLGAAPGQCVVADSTTVLLYKLARAAIAARPGRTRVLVDRDNFPSDRFIVEGIAAECGLELDWLEPPHGGGVTADAVRAAVGPDTALVLLSHVAYRSGYIADIPAITTAAHDAGALVLWDLCHSAGVLPVELDAWGVDLAAGCSYKYLNGGPGAPAWAYVRTELQHFQQPIQGWLGSSEPFEMGQGYEPAGGIRRFTSGTPPIIGMTAMQDMIALIDEAGLAAVRDKSVALTEFAIEAVQASLADFGVVVASPLNPAERGGHVTIDHPAFKHVTARLWEQGVIPDFREPDGIRLGLSPLSTSFAEVWRGIAAIRAELERA
ncbi:aminotransferase class V-fold PLP-dependent enzyme [Arthrobacter sp. CAU 1506]|uniref:kynureninase n=1 Tax=Arthrobacter sp. CAU 1506 TaxID=2560052 RepID=UPI0010AB6829|nr:aminotransferase class V-fold PLP-dependent enzyme [Arthrobacter sp. CAU 1506]TJY67611.1 aminotransferase class V-fold PLP-dependent enzyme [Arthrobacter sp. CAU 1506]